MTARWDLSERPIIVAPMGGGPSTPSLVVAAASAGALGFLAAGYKSPAEVEAQIAEVRARSSGPFGVNVFVPGAPTGEPERLASYLRELAAEADALGVELGPATWEDDHWGAKIEIVLDAAPAVCSFAFGLPDAAVVSALQRRGTSVVITVTSVAEADAATAVGADGLCVQGIEAGAHRGSFTDDAPLGEGLGMLALVEAIRDRFGVVPLIAAGGIARPEDVASALDAGAVGVQAGTAFLRCTESAASPLHKAALVDPAFDATAFTRSFSGRRARGLVNRFMRDHPDAPSAYPEINNATRPLRAAAVGRSDAGGTNLWAGTGHRHARDGSAAAIVDWLAEGLPPFRIL